MDPSSMKTKAVLLVLPVLAACSFGLYAIVKTEAVSAPTEPAAPKRTLSYQPRKSEDTGGFIAILSGLQPIKDPSSLESIRDAFEDLDRRGIAEIDKRLASDDLPVENKPALFLSKASLFMYGGDPPAAYEVLQQARALCKSSDPLAAEWLSSIVFFQGVPGLRRGEIRHCVE